MKRGSTGAVAIVVAALLLGGCAADVVMVDPRTGVTVTCHDSSRGLNPWSQREACVSEYIAKGWTRGPEQ